MTTLDVTWPDVETSSDAYANRFAGDTGTYLLDVQQRAIADLLGGDTPRAVLDLAGGHCQLVDQLLATGAEVTILGSDHRCAERLARTRHADTVAFEASELLATPYPDARFDLVTCIRLMAHMEHWHVLVAELCRVARSTVIVDYPSLSGLNALSALAWPVKRAIEGDTRTYRSFWPGQVARQFKANGFRCTQTYRQFAIPMGLHRLIGQPAGRAEEWLRTAGATAMIGNPVMARFDRIAA